MLKLLLLWRYERTMAIGIRDKNDPPETQMVKINRYRWWVYVKFMEHSFNRNIFKENGWGHKEIKKWAGFKEKEVNNNGKWDNNRQGRRMKMSKLFFKSAKYINKRRHFCLSPRSFFSFLCFVYHHLFTLSLALIILLYIHEKVVSHRFFSHGYLLSHF